ncbi:hypothetical protein NDU88_001722 [Pleurodeles waltl]|uniref:Uncharacterized protein n=1 Tax=Pleurodeles waltl TaxID=8319 RepID=A0AAV7WPH4_PLEWA|nr:hypothetical protein NDU88_001722 [Pleurodeles waltl]
MRAPPLRHADSASILGGSPGGPFLSRPQLYLPLSSLTAGRQRARRSLPWRQPATSNRGASSGSLVCVGSDIGNSGCFLGAPRGRGSSRKDLRD